MKRSKFSEEQVDSPSAKPKLVPPSAEVANGTPGVMCPQVNGILARIAGHNAEFVKYIGYSYVFGLAITAAVRF